MKRPTWDDYFIGLCKAVARRSYDSKTKVGSVLVRANRVVSCGFNGLKAGEPDSPQNWQKPAAYSRIIHAEANCITYAGVQDLSDCTLYVSIQPCEHCLRLISEKGIRRVVFGKTSKKFKKRYNYKLVQKLASESGMELLEYGQEMYNSYWSKIWALVSFRKAADKV